MAIKSRFDLGDIVEISFPTSKVTRRVVVSDLMSNGIDVYFHDETGQIGCSARLGLYRRIHHDSTTSRRMRAIDQQIEDLVEERDSLIEHRLRFKDDDEDDLIG